MYLEHFGLGEAPFRITPHTDFFFQGANRGATLEALSYAITSDEGIVKVSGEVGSGKTMLCRVLMERLPRHVETIYIADPSLDRSELLMAIADELRLELRNERASRVLRALQEHLIALYGQGRRVVVLIDEAHAMPKQTLEEIRLLSNLEANRNKLLQIVLFGQPELDQHLDTADMRQLKERITHHFVLEPLRHADIEGYIDFRMRAAGYRGPSVFSAGAVRLIADASEGLTRRINILCDKALLAAYAKGSHAITEREVKRAIADTRFYKRPAGWRRYGVPAGTLAAGLALGWAATMLTGADSPTRTGQGRLSASTSLGPAAGDGAHAEARLMATRAAATAQTAASTEAAPRAAPEPVPGAGPAPAQTAAATGAPAREPEAPAAAASPQNPEPERPRPEGAGEARDPRGPVPPAKGELARERFAATQELLKAVPAEHHALQLLTVKAQDVGRLESFLAKALKEVRREDLHVYSVKIDGQQHYRAAYGNYPGASAAREAEKELSPLLRAQHPYRRSFERMRSQNRQ